MSTTAPLSLETRLDRLTNAQLAEIYNAAADRPVSKFSDHTTAVRRTLNLLDQLGWDFVTDEDGKIVAGPKGEKVHGDRDERVITVLSEVNPKQKGSTAHKMFELYRTGMTVGEYAEGVKKLGATRRRVSRSIAWDVEHGYISVSNKA